MELSFESEEVREGPSHSFDQGDPRALETFHSLYADKTGGLPQSASVQHFPENAAAKSLDYRARLVIPAGATAQTAGATFILQTEEFVPQVIETFTVANPSLGTDQRIDLDWSTEPGAGRTTSDFGKRSIVLLSGASRRAAKPVLN